MLLQIPLKHAEALFEAGADAIVIDTAHGHSAGVLCKIAEIRAHFPDRTLIAEILQLLRVHVPFMRQV